MPKVDGGFHDYVLPSRDAEDYPPDEEAATMAMDYMLSMCGNAGQEALVADILNEFYEWAMEILEDESAVRGSSWADFAEYVADEWYGGRWDKFMAIEQILGEGWAVVAEQSGYHDSYDELGEGTGREFG